MRVAQYILVPKVHKLKEYRTIPEAFAMAYELGLDGKEFMVAKVITQKKPKEEVLVVDERQGVLLNVA